MTKHQLRDRAVRRAYRTLSEVKRSYQRSRPTSVLGDVTRGNAIARLTAALQHLEELPVLRKEGP